MDIADDVLTAAKGRARRENRTAGEVISKVVRAALTASSPELRIIGDDWLHSTGPFSTDAAIGVDPRHLLML